MIPLTRCESLLCHLWGKVAVAGGTPPCWLGDNAPVCTAGKTKRWHHADQHSRKRVFFPVVLGPNMVPRRAVPLVAVPAATSHMCNPPPLCGWGPAVLIGLKTTAVVAALGTSSASCERFSRKTDACLHSARAKRVFLRLHTAS